MKNKEKVKKYLNDIKKRVKNKKTDFSYYIKLSAYVIFVIGFIIYFVYSIQVLQYDKDVFKLYMKPTFHSHNLYILDSQYKRVLKTINFKYERAWCLYGGKLKNGDYYVDSINLSDIITSSPTQVTFRCNPNGMIGILHTHPDYTPVLSTADINAFKKSVDEKAKYIQISGVIGIQHGCIDIYFISKEKEKLNVKIVNRNEMIKEIIKS